MNLFQEEHESLKQYVEKYTAKPLSLFSEPKRQRLSDKAVKATLIGI